MGGQTITQSKHLDI